MSKFKSFIVQYWYYMLVLFLSGLLGMLTSLIIHKPSQQAATTRVDVSQDLAILRTFHNPVSFSQQIKGDPLAGKKIYATYCHVCHDVNAVIPVSAPTLNQTNRWRALAKLGLTPLTQITIRGINAMPARGGCFECTDKQIQQAIQYMLSISLSLKKNSK